MHMLLAKKFCGAFYVPVFGDLSMIVQSLSIISGQCEHHKNSETCQAEQNELEQALPFIWVGTKPPSVAQK